MGRAACSIIAVMAVSWPLSPRHGAAAAPAGGPGRYYLALGDSVAYGKQPNDNFTQGYADQFFSYLKPLGARYLINMACPGQKSSTFINGRCKYQAELKYPYTGSQLQAALAFIQAHPRQVSPVTIDLGINDMAYVQNFKVCTLLTPHDYATRLGVYAANMGSIFARLHAALRGGALLAITNYPAHVNQCPTNAPVVAAFNHALSVQAGRYGVRVAPVFDAFGGAAVPNTALCAYTWICAPPQDFHPTTRGYAVIAQALEGVAGYGAMPVTVTTEAASARPPAPVGPTSGMDNGVIVRSAATASYTGTASYTFTAGASGPTTVGQCPHSLMLNNELAVYDSARRLLAQMATTPAMKDGSECNWVGISATAGRTYTVVVSARTRSGHFVYSSAWSINHAPVTWQMESTTHVTRRYDYNFVNLSPDTMRATVCGLTHATFTLSFKSGKDVVLASTARPARCQSLAYTPPNRDNYRLQVLAVRGSGAWSGTITTY